MIHIIEATAGRHISTQVVEDKCLISNSGVTSAFPRKVVVYVVC